MMAIYKVSDGVMPLQIHFQGQATARAATKNDFHVQVMQDPPLQVVSHK